jgi:subtilisin family serine protease
MNQLASFSNYGAKSVAIGAPGVDILSTWLDNEYEEKSGTSMATPVVAGVAAFVVAENPRISVDDLRKRLLDSTDPIVALKGKTVPVEESTPRKHWIKSGLSVILRIG